MRTILKGNISFYGIVNIPIQLITIQKEHKINLNNLCPLGHKIKLKNYCEECNKYYEYNELIKGFRISENEYIKLTKEQLESIKETNSKTIEILKAIDLNDLKFLKVKKCYALLPDINEKSYLLLRESLKQNGKVLIGKMVFRNKQNLVGIVNYKNYLLLVNLFYDDEIIEPQLDVKELKFSKEELELMNKLLEKLSKEKVEIKDDYNDKLFELIQNPKKKVVKKISKDVDIKEQLKLLVGK